MHELTIAHEERRSKYQPEYQWNYQKYSRDESAITTSVHEKSERNRLYEAELRAKENELFNFGIVDEVADTTSNVVEFASFNSQVETPKQSTSEAGSGPFNLSLENPSADMPMSKAQSALQVFWEYERKLPSIRYLSKLARVRFNDAKQALTSFSGDTADGAEMAAPYIVSSNVTVKEPVLNFATFKLRDRITFDNATAALLNHGPNTCHLITLVCPSNSELACTAFATHSQPLINHLLRELLPDGSNLGIGDGTDNRAFFTNNSDPLDKLPHVWKREQRKDGRPHFHLLIALEPAQVPSLTQLTSAWNSALKYLNQLTHCQPFHNEDGAVAISPCQNNPHCQGKACYLGDWVHITPFVELEPNRYVWSYLAKGKQRKNDSASHYDYGAFNNSTKNLALNNTNTVDIPFTSREAAHSFLNDYVKLKLDTDSRYPWKSVGRDRYLHESQRSRILPTHWQATVDLFQKLEKQYGCDALFSKDNFRLHLELTPNRYLFARVYSQRPPKSSRTRTGAKATKPSYRLDYSERA